MATAAERIAELEARKTLVEAAYQRALLAEQYSRGSNMKRSASLDSLSRELRSIENELSMLGTSGTKGAGRMTFTRQPY